MINQLTIFDAMGIKAPYLERHKDDFYETPSLLTLEFLEKVNVAGNVFEPCAGNNQISNVLEYQRKNSILIKNVFCSDIAWENSKPKDATRKEFWDYWRSHIETETKGNLDWVVTNPPFKSASKILPLAYEYANTGVAFLLRSSYSEPCRNRRQWLIEHSDNFRYRIDINPRPKFREEGSGDLVTCTWFVWLKRWSWREKGIECPFLFITDWNKNQ